jgi:hypothetical protein
MTKSELPFAVRASCILWPAFLMAGVLEMLIFSVVNPDDLHWFGTESIHGTATTIYSVTFLAIWGVMALSGALTQLLLSSPQDSVLGSALMH